MIGLVFHGIECDGAGLERGRGGERGHGKRLLFDMNLQPYNVWCKFWWK